jgi:hypothetical protein
VDGAATIRTGLPAALILLPAIVNRARLAPREDMRPHLLPRKKLLRPLSVLHARLLTILRKYPRRAFAAATAIPDWLHV